jgi:hypothetical protein
MIVPKNYGDLAKRITNKIQLTTDGHKAYLMAVDGAFGKWNIDYAILHKIFGKEERHDTKYSPAKCVGIEKEVIAGLPERIKFQPVLLSGRILQ